MKTHRTLSQIALVVAVLLLSVGIQTFASAQPSTSAPNGDAPTPLTTDSSAQSKAAGLVLNTGSAPAGLIVQLGNVGIGTTTPTQKLEVAGIIKSSLGGIMFPDGTVQITAAGGGTSVGSLGCVTRVKGNTPEAYCNPDEIMTDGICQAVDVVEDCDTSAYGALYAVKSGSDGIKCNQVACSDFTAHARCCRTDGVPAAESVFLHKWVHTKSDCTALTALGGTVVNNGSGTNFCKVSGSSCPSGWTKYYDYSTTVAKTCTGTNDTGCTGATSCTTGIHAFSNAVAETCSYKNRTKPVLFCWDSNQTCTATVSHVGCY